VGAALIRNRARRAPSRFALELGVLHFAEEGRNGRAVQKHLTILKEKTTLFCAITGAELSQMRSIGLVASF
jgi:hypothetical protein